MINSDGKQDFLEEHTNSKLDNIQNQLRVIADNLQIQINQLRQKMDSYDRKLAEVRDRR